MSEFEVGKKVGRYTVLKRTEKSVFFSVDGVETPMRRKIYSFSYNGVPFSEYAYVFRGKHLQVIAWPYEMK